jgi:hypothetical protein
MELQQLMYADPAFIGRDRVRGRHSERALKFIALEKAYHGSGVADIYRQKHWPVSPCPSLHGSKTTPPWLRPFKVAPA